MEKRIAELIIEAGQQCDVEEMKIYEDYSGRGMYGKKTAGIVFDNQTDLLRAVAQAALDLADTEDDHGFNEDRVTRDEFIESLDFRQDNMGRSTIVY